MSCKLPDTRIRLPATEATQVNVKHAETTETTEEINIRDSTQNSELRMFIQI